MTIEASGFGARVNLIASQTFPAGLEITEFADDTNPVDMPNVQVSDVAMGVNGHLIRWSKANPIIATIGVIPGGVDDDNLRALAVANRASRGRRAVLDNITMTITYPNGSNKRLLRGVITDGSLGKGVASSGRLQTGAYTFKFEDMQ